MNNFRIGTCSWNYDSWVGLLYKKPLPNSLAYLPEYAKKYNTVEIDSWFYKIPNDTDVLEYSNSVPADFLFTCKAPQMLTQVFKYGTKEKNPLFLSTDLFKEFYDRIIQMKHKINSIIFEFEYINKEKMNSFSDFSIAFQNFINNIPRNIPISLETRNGNYLTDSYFSMLLDNDIAHVFSEKIYMPSICEIIDKNKNKLTNKVVIRLLGGDRKIIEEKTNNTWNSIVDEKNVTPIVNRVIDLLDLGKNITVNINNHYEGSAPLTINKFISEMKIAAPKYSI
jgi:uncharacterized protein YecE (DUF72 family)